jgi:hypothetical protein
VEIKKMSDEEMRTWVESEKKGATEADAKRYKRQEWFERILGAAVLTTILAVCAYVNFWGSWFLAGAIIGILVWEAMTRFIPIYSGA